MLCSRCGADVAPDAGFCPRCGTPTEGPAGTSSPEQLREAALAAFKADQGTMGVECPGCGGYRMEVVRHDAEEMLFWSAALGVLGVASLFIVLIAGDVGLLVADLSSIAIACMVVGVLLLVAARYRRRPNAFECLSGGYRVP